MKKSLSSHCEVFLPQVHKAKFWVGSTVFHEIGAWLYKIKCEQWTCFSDMVQEFGLRNCSGSSEAGPRPRSCRRRMWRSGTGTAAEPSWSASGSIIGRRRISVLSWYLAFRYWYIAMYWIATGADLIGCQISICSSRVLTKAPLWCRVCGHAGRLQRQGCWPVGQRDTLDQVPLIKQFN